jgi:hypothetical protein
VSSRIPPTLVLLAAIVYACGPRPHSAEKAVGTTTVSTPEVTSALDVRVGREVELDFRVTNNGGKSVELLFPTGHTFDIVVTDTLGRTVWRWSDGRVFTQGLRSSVLEREEGMTYRASWAPGSVHGAFYAVANLRSENHPLERRVRFDVP